MSRAPVESRWRMAGAVALGGLVFGLVIWIVQLRAENGYLRALLEGRTAAPGAGDVGDGVATAEAAASGPRALGATEREAMLARLRAETGPERAVWFTTARGDPEATAFAAALRAIFVEAGWSVRGNTIAPFAVKPGLIVLMADAEPPSFASSAVEALEAAGLVVTSGTAYRDYYKEMRAENPSWVGFDLAPDQAYVVVVGPRPLP